MRRLHPSRVVADSLRRLNVDSVVDVYFQPLSNRELEEQLHQDHDFKDEHTHFLAYFAQGCPGAAKRFIDDEVIDYKNEVIEGFIFRRPDDAYLKEIVADKEQANKYLYQ